MVLKPSETTPLTALKFAEVVAGILPPGVFNLVLGRGASVGQALISHPGVRMVSLTGDVGTGQAVLAAAAKSVRRTHLELGGKAPVIVFDDADLDAVVAGLRTFGYYNAGQDCTAACRVYAGAKIYDKLVADLTSAVASLKVGLPDDAEAELGSLISARQRERVAGFVDRARDLGHVEITTGGKAGEGGGFFYAPTVVAGALQSDEIVRREVFGPVVSVTRLHRGRRGGDLGQRHRLRPRLLGVDAGHRQGDGGRPRACNTAARGSTLISCWSTRCRTAA